MSMAGSSPTSRPAREGLRVFPGRIEALLSYLPVTVQGSVFSSLQIVQEKLPEGRPG